MKKTGQYMKCDNCGVSIYVTKYGLKHNENHFCSMDCYNVFRIGKQRTPLSEEVKQKISSSLKGFKHSDETKKKMSVVQKGKPKKSTTKETIIKIKEAIARNGGLKKEKNPRWKGGITYTLDYCSNCGKEHNFNSNNFKKSKNHFCSRKCQGEYRSKYLIGEDNPIYKAIKCECDYCKKTIFRNQSQHKRVKHYFCSKECFNKYKIENELYTGEKNPRWRGGMSFEPYPVKWSNKLRESIRLRDNYICYICKSPQEHKRLDVHHIDYNKDNLNPINLITLCKKCHTKTNSNREHWVDYFKQELNGTN